MLKKKKKKNPFMDGFRKWGLNGPKEAAFPSDVCYLGDAVISLVAAEGTTTLQYKGASMKADTVTGTMVKHRILQRCGRA